MKLRYNAPVTLTFTLLAGIVLLLTLTVVPSLTTNWFSTPAPFRWNSFGDILRLFSYVFGHASIQHYMGNFTMILLLGPILEASYGSLFILLSMATTAFVGGLLNVLLFPTTMLLGASGIVFMMIVLASITNFRKGEIPLTFILIMVIYVGGQVWDAIAVKDNISHFTHILGGFTGSFFGFFKRKE